MNAQDFSHVEAATRVVLAWAPTTGRGAPGKALAELIVRELRAAVAKEREACARKADGLAYRPCSEGTDACEATQTIARWIRARGDRECVADERAGVADERAAVDAMVRGLVRGVEIKECDEGGRLWDDATRTALEEARRRGWGRDRVGTLARGEA